MVFQKWVIKRSNYYAYLGGRYFWWSFFLADSSKCSPLSHCLSRNHSIPPLRLAPTPPPSPDGQDPPWSFLHNTLGRPRGLAIFLFTYAISFKAKKKMPKKIHFSFQLAQLSVGCLQDFRQLARPNGITDLGRRFVHSLFFERFLATVALARQSRQVEQSQSQGEDHRMEKWIELANHLMTRWRMGTESRSHKRMNGTPGPDRTRDSDNRGNRQKEMGRILESAQKS